MNEFARSGYEATLYRNGDEGVSTLKNQPGVKAHFKRNAGKYAGAGIGSVLSATASHGGADGTPLLIAGIGAGLIADKFRAERAHKKLLEEKGIKFMNATRTIALCAELKTKLDTVLFRRMEDEEPQGSTAGAVAKGAAIAGGSVYAGSALKRGLAPLVGDRRSGMRATVEGFTGASPLMQNVRATGSVLGSNPLKAASAVGSTIASDARAVGSAAKNLAPVKGFLRARAGGAGVGGALKRGLGSGIKAATRGRFGFQSLQSQVIEFAKEVEALGFDSLANYDHVPGGMSRAVFGTIAAKKGKKLEATKEVMGDQLSHTAKIASIGVPLGIAGFAGSGRLRHKIPLKTRIAAGALAGVAGSAILGGITGPNVNDRKYDRHFK